MDMKENITLADVNTALKKHYKHCVYDAVAWNEDHTAIKLNLCWLLMNSRPCKDYAKFLMKKFPFIDMVWTDSSVYSRRMFNL